VSDEGDVADDAATDGSDTEDAKDNGGSGNRTAVVTKAVARPQRPTGKRSRQRALDTEDDESSVDDESTETEVSKKDSAQKGSSKSVQSKKSAKSKSAKQDTAKKAKKSGSSSSVNPLVFVYNYIKQVVAEMRKVIWPNRKQMISYTSVVLVFLAFMVALVAGADLGLSKLVLLVFG
jgi:preprotein translocase subunit SecE